jgi:SAM-dependent methyltransferase
MRLPAPLFKVWNRGKIQFICPICNYEGPFADFRSFAGDRKYSICPHCGALERHRLQYLTVKIALQYVNTAEMKMIHFAPEDFLRSIFVSLVRTYETADLFMKGVDYRVNIENMPFPDESYDFVFASHVLEHVRDDRKAIREIRRVLRPHGVAILPVPVVCSKTIEYPEPNPYEAGHVRAPGLDYFERYREYFSRVEIHTSDSFPEKHQLFIYEDRSVWPTKDCPLRSPMQGERHADFVPVCYA